MPFAVRPPTLPVPTCPGWTLRELVLHQGEVHRWAAAVVAVGASKPSAVSSELTEPLPTDSALATWLDEGITALLAALEQAEPELAAFTFLADAPAPRLFWARRQAHETGMHRVDAESASGPITPFAARFAADGIDEMLTGFAPRPRTPLHNDPPVSMNVATTDAAGEWNITISPDPPVTVRATGTADCSVSGAASDVLQALWNRQDGHRLTVQGDASVLTNFCTSVRVRWS